MRFTVPIFACFLIAGCEETRTAETTKPERYSAQQIREALPGITEACIAKLQRDNTGMVPADQCFDMQEARRFRGLWRDDFEGSRFCPAPAQECTFDTAGDRIWLDFSFSVPADQKRKAFGGLYEIDFIGRRTAVPGRYGHLGMFDAEIIADRMISMKEIEQLTKE
jgi:hypothetical protein